MLMQFDLFRFKKLKLNYSAYLNYRTEIKLIIISVNFDEVNKVRLLPPKKNPIFYMLV